MKKSTVIALIGVLCTVLGRFALYPINNAIGLIVTLVGLVCAVTGLILTIKGR